MCIVLVSKSLGQAAPCPYVSDVHAFNALRLLGASINRVEPAIDPYGQFYPEELVILKQGRPLRRLPGHGFVRGWSFWDEGRQIVAEVGPLHFSENYELVDLKTGKVIAWFTLPADIGKEPPDWVKAIQRSNREQSPPKQDCRFRR